MLKKISAFIMVIALASSNLIIVNAVEPDENVSFMQEIPENIETENTEEDIQEETVLTDELETKTEEVQNLIYVGSSEEEVPEEILNDENTIIKYVYNENAEEGTVLNQLYEDDDMILEIATEPL